jgi:hypothetical protein
MASIQISATRPRTVFTQRGPDIAPCADEDVPPPEAVVGGGGRSATTFGLAQGLGGVDLAKELAGLNLKAPTAPSAAPSAETVNVVGVSDPAKDKEHPSPWFVLAAYVLLAAGVGLGYLLATAWLKPVTTYAVVDGIGLFAIYYVAAQALERLMEPLAGLEIPNFGGSRRLAENRRDEKIVKTQKLIESPDPKALKAAQAEADDAAGDQAKATQIKGNTQVVVWAAASFLAMLLSGAMGLYLLEVIGVKGAPLYLNILVTGLAVGAGTEPLHKLIKLLEKKSEET